MNGSRNLRSKKKGPRQDGKRGGVGAVDLFPAWRGRADVAHTSFFTHRLLDSVSKASE